jgi:hypothetical protein
MPDVSPPNPSESNNSAPSPDRLKADLGAARETLGAAAGDIVETATEQASELKDAAAEQLAQASERAKSFAAEHKDVAAGQIGGVSNALSKVADELASGEQTAAMAGYARTLANGVQQAADTMRQSSVDDLLAMARDFGRRQPVAFLGAAALAGFAASRFIMATAERRSGVPAASGDSSGVGDAAASGISAGSNGSAGNANQEGAFK